jgi:hypothetical protein
MNPLQTLVDMFSDDICITELERVLSENYMTKTLVIVEDEQQLDDIYKTFSETSKQDFKEYVKFVTQHNSTWDVNDHITLVIAYLPTILTGPVSIVGLRNYLRGYLGHCAFELIVATPAPVIDYQI